MRWILDKKNWILRLPCLALNINVYIYMDAIHCMCVLHSNKRSEHIWQFLFSFTLFFFSFCCSLCIGQLFLFITTNYRWVREKGISLSKYLTYTCTLSTKNVKQQKNIYIHVCIIWCILNAIHNFFILLCYLFLRFAVAFLTQIREQN